MKFLTPLALSLAASTAVAQYTEYPCNNCDKWVDIEANCAVSFKHFATFIQWIFVYLHL